MINDAMMTAFFEGQHQELHHVFGAHIVGEDTVFTVYAPNAKHVKLIGSFNAPDQFSGVNSWYAVIIATTHFPGRQAVFQKALNIVIAETY